MKDTQCGRDAEPKAKGGCISTYRTNFAYVDSMKVNTMSFKQMEEFGVYMVTNSFGFSMKYLELSYLRLLRGNLTPGQEGRVRLMSENGKPIHAQRFQSHTQSFGRICSFKTYSWSSYSIPSRQPIKLWEVQLKAFHILSPFKSADLEFRWPLRSPQASEPRMGWRATNYSTTRQAKNQEIWEGSKNMHLCHKDKQRITKANRTAGWQFVIDPQSRRVLAAKEHIVNETCADKVDAVQAAMALPKVHANALVHDDACHFQNYVQRRQSLKKTFRSIQHMIVDEFHRRNHKCRKAQLTRSEAKRLRGIPTNMSEVFNSWMRRKNFFGMAWRDVAIGFGSVKALGSGMQICARCQASRGAEPQRRPATGRRGISWVWKYEKRLWEQVRTKHRKKQTAKTWEEPENHKGQCLWTKLLAHTFLTNLFLFGFLPGFWVFGGPSSR